MGEKKGKFDASVDCRNRIWRRLLLGPLRQSCVRLACQWGLSSPVRRWSHRYKLCTFVSADGQYHLSVIVISLCVLRKMGEM